MTGTDMDYETLLERYRCERIEAAYPPKYKCCGSYFHDRKGLLMHVRHMHKEVWENELRPVVERLEMLDEISRSQNTPKRKRGNPHFRRFISVPMGGKVK